MIETASRSLAAGDPLGALKMVALRDDAPALALRGIAMAQLGDFHRANTLLRRAARSFGAKNPLARARCVVAEAEIALASRELGWPEAMLETARVSLEHHGDRANAAHARYLQIKRLLLIGRIEDAERLLAALDPSPFAHALRTAHELVVMGIAIRRLRITEAHAALARADSAALRARIPALTAEVERAAAIIQSPAARVFENREDRLLRLDEIEALFASRALIVDGCRHVVRRENTVVSLATRPVLFSIALALSQAWPEDMSRDELVRRVFGARSADESHRARLRVEVGRLRSALRGIAEVRATKRGFSMQGGERVVVLDWPSQSSGPRSPEHGSVLGLLSDGESWSSSALALALGISQRSVQRVLDALAGEGRVSPVGEGRARRWMTPLAAGFAPILLLPTPPVE